MPSSPSPRADHRTILFVDVVASTELYDDLGDADARARIGPCLTALGELIESHDGDIVKSLGDGLLAAFRAEDQAVAAALRMLAIAPDHGLQVRIGVQAGDVLVEGGDMFGQAVNTASRLAAMARPSEAIVTRAVVDHLPAPLRAGAQRLHRVPVKGLHEHLELYAVRRFDPSATRSTAASIEIADDLPALGLRLRCGGRSWDVDPLAGAHLGRHPTNDVVVTGDHVSRRHAMIVARHGTYVLIDQSVNGTWVVADDGTRAHLLRGEATLHGAGNIVLGLPPDEPGATPIHYHTTGATEGSEASL